MGGLVYGKMVPALCMPRATSISSIELVMVRANDDPIYFRGNYSFHVRTEVSWSVAVARMLAVHEYHYPFFFKFLK